MAGMDIALFGGGGAVLVVLIGVLLRQTARTGESERRRADECRRADEAEAKADEAEAKVRDFEVALSRLERVIDGLGVAIWRRNADGELIDNNRAAVPLLRVNEMPGLLARRAMSVGSAQVESRRAVVDGTPRMFQVTAEPLSDAEGGGAIGHAVDMTELEDLQGELERHVAAQQDVLQKLATAIAIFGPDRRLTFANTAFARLWRLDVSIISESPSLIELLEALRERRRLPEQSDYRAYREEWSALFTSVIDSHEELLFLPDDTTIRMVVTPHPFGGLLMTFEDVTDMLALERSFNTALEVQRETIDHLRDGVAVFGADGRLRLANPAFLELWSLPASLRDGEAHFSQVVDAMRPCFDAAAPWDEIRATSILHIGEREVASERLARVGGGAVDADYLPLPDGGTLITYRDISDSLNVQRILQERNEALVTADRLKSEFIANISYELRTPLNAITGFAELLHDPRFGPLNDRQLSYTDAIVESSERLVRLVDNILDLASIEAGYMELDRKQVDILDLIADVEMLCQERARANGLELRRAIDIDLETIEGDPVRLTQALYNLMSNAMNFSVSGGTVTLAAQVDGPEIVFSVIDTGSGIAPEEQGQVFERFERAGRAASPGVGLGLSLVKSLIELHGGTVELESALDEGTTVRLRLPIGQA